MYTEHLLCVTSGSPHPNLIDLSRRNDTIASVCKVDSDPEEAAEEAAEAEIAMENRESIDTITGEIEMQEAETILDEEIQEVEGNLANDEIVE